MIRRPSRGSRIGVVAFFLIFSALRCWASGASGVSVEFLEPHPGVAVFGPTRLALEISGFTEGATVRMLLDGSPVAAMKGPPFEAVVDVGEENREHTFEAELRDGEGRVLATTSVRTPRIRIDDVVELKLQQVFATVTGSRGRRVLGLGKEEFRLEEDGLEQALVTVASGKIPFTAVLLVDASVSMDEERTAAARRGLQAFASGMRAHDEAKVVFFADRLLAASPFSQDPEDLTAAVVAAESRGGTALADHLFLSLRLLETRLGRPVVILLSDGGDIHSVLRLAEVRSQLRRSQAMLYFVEITDTGTDSRSLIHSFLPPAKVRAAGQQLRRMVRESGGRTLKILHAEEIPAALAEILKELREQYALGYYPEASGGDRWRPLEVRVRRPGLKVRAPEGYFSPSAELP